MAKLYDETIDRFQEPIKVYLNIKTKELLEDDCEIFGFNSRNKFYNVLITNYVNDYINHIEIDSKQTLAIMENLISTDSKEEFPIIAKKIVYKNISFEDIKERSDYISLRINIDSIIQIAEIISATNEDIKFSAFFRDLFSNYLSLPVYRREQIIFNDQYKKIMKSIENKQKISYWNKNTRKSHNLSVHSIEQSRIEFHNYVVGSSDNYAGAYSIKLSSIGSVRLLDEKSCFNNTFNECYEVMKRNGCQFGVEAPEIWKVYLTDDDIKIYNNRYLDRPKIRKKGVDDKGKYYVFDCSKFQLEGYFNPFGGRIECIKLN